MTAAASFGQNRKSLCLLRQSYHGCTLKVPQKNNFVPSFQNDGEIEKEEGEKTIVGNGGGAAAGNNDTTGRSDWILHRKGKYSICCLREVQDTKHFNFRGKLQLDHPVQTPLRLKLNTRHRFRLRLRFRCFHRARLQPPFRRQRRRRRRRSSCTGPSSNAQILMWMEKVCLHSFSHFQRSNM